ncbi:MAG: EamA family transporter [Hyphomicrobiaceae bacterium]|nr:EamA family transporter [Hyphomicrobiaceae bacterium]
MTRAAARPPLSRPLATAIGLAAIAMWATLGLLTAASGSVPPFQMNVLTFGLSGVLSCLWLAARGRLGAALRQPWQVWLLGLAGLFGYHALYFTALRNAPPVDAGLIAYLWPLLIVLFSGLLPGERLRWHHVCGAGLGFLGAVVIVTRGGGLSIDPAYALGYLAALGCAVTWSTYSVLSRRFGEAPTDAVAGFCLATAILSTPCHLAFETTVWPAEPLQWAAIVALGLLPVGAAFFVWDIGMKRGDIQILGAASYATPLASTLVLILAGFGAFTWQVAVAALLITLGALLAAKDMLAGRQT